jgi:DHA1 family inner membrane transport protein
VSIASPPPRAVPVGMALPGLVIAVAMIGDTLLYVVLPFYHQDFGISLAMVGVLLSLNRWIRLLANSGVAAIGERVGPHALMVMAAVGSVVSTTLYGLVENDAVQVAARILWGISYASLNLSTLAYAVSDRANAGKRVGASRAAIGIVQAVALVGGAWIALEVGPRSVFLIFGGLTLISLGAALLLPRLPREIADKKSFRLPIPHRLETWGFMLGFTSSPGWRRCWRRRSSWRCAGWSRSPPGRWAAGSATASARGASRSPTACCWSQGSR